MKHIMVDLETMGTSPTSAIMSIGAAIFDPCGIGVESTFYTNVFLDSCVKHGLTMDAETVEFWLDQPNETRALLKKDRCTLPIALGKLSAFVHFSNTDDNRVRVWAHGAGFDPVLLDNAFRACNLTVPWAYNTPRDTRTVYEIAGVDLKTFPGTGVLHYALDDAAHQVLALQEAFRRIETH